jgi:hypothetical protein
MGGPPYQDTARKRVKTGKLAEQPACVHDSGRNNRAGIQPLFGKLKREKVEGNRKN